jgi:hypothetical protein
MEKAGPARGWPRVWVSVALLAASPLAARATGLDGAGQRMIVPLVFTGGDRESTVTLTNVHVQPASLSIVYVGAEGTRHAASVDGQIACANQTVPPGASISERLRDLCPGIYEGDVENFGYLVVTVRVDPPAVGRLFVETVVDGLFGIPSGITGQPVGAYNSAPPSPATLGLEVGGLRTRAGGAERPVCFVASLDEKKTVDLDLRDASGASLGSTVSLVLDADRMERIDLQSRFGLSPQDRDELRLTAVSTDGALVVIGCGAERLANLALAYQPARSPDAGDLSRVHSAYVNAFLRPGPYTIGAAFAHIAVGAPHNAKITLSTYLRAEDEVRCLLQPWNYQPPFDSTPWIEIQLRNPLGQVVAGGSTVRSFVYRTPPRGSLPVGTSQEYFIEISFDEDAALPWPSGYLGGLWQLACESGAGMSEPIPVPIELNDF